MPEEFALDRDRRIAICPEGHESPSWSAERERKPEFVADRRRRAGVEGTLSRGVPTMGLRRARHVGPAKTRLQHLLAAAAISLARLAAWTANTPAARTRRSAFARPMSSPAAPAQGPPAAPKPGCGQPREARFQQA